MAIIKKGDDKFVASNGVPIVGIARPLGDDLWFAIGESADLLTAHEVEALREYFIQERDEQLGRWRSPEHPDFAVYPIKDGDAVWVLNEAEAGAIRASAPATRINARATNNPYDLAANAYFAAHPEPKPWEVDPKFGDAWVFKSADSDRELLAVWRATNGGELRWAATDGLVNRADLSSGRKVWSAS